MHIMYPQESGHTAAFQSIYFVNLPLLINIKTINISSPNTTEERYNEGLKSKEKRAVKGRRKRGMYENVKEMWKRTDKTNKGNTSRGRGWENKKKRVQRMKGRKVD